jgi:uncharacterized damage-inducible protein DinB
MESNENNYLVGRIVKLLNAAFHGGAWHGPSALEVIKPVKPKQAEFKLGNVHTIAELIYHMTSWRIFAIQKVNGNEKYEIIGDKDFGKFGKIDKFELETLLMEMSLSHDELLSVLMDKTDDFLMENVPGTEYDYYTLLHGIIHHDLYHTGQIAVLKKLIDRKSEKLDEISTSSRFFEEGYGDTF